VLVSVVTLRLFEWARRCVGVVGKAAHIKQMLLWRLAGGPRSGPAPGHSLGASLTVSPWHLNEPAGPYPTLEAGSPHPAHPTEAPVPRMLAAVMGFLQPANQPAHARVDSNSSFRAVQVYQQPTDLPAGVCQQWCVVLPARLHGSRDSTVGSDWPAPHRTSWSALPGCSQHRCQWTAGPVAAGGRGSSCGSRRQEESRACGSRAAPGAAAQ